MPASSKPNLVTSFTAVSAIAQFAPVAADGTQAGAGAAAIGFAQNSAIAGQRVALAVEGSSIAVCSGVMPLFSGVQVGAGGTVVALASGVRIGTALTAGVDGDRIEVQVQQSFSGGSFGVADSLTLGALPFAPAGIDATVVATAPPMWFPAAGKTRAFIAPSTASEGVKVSLGSAAAVSETYDRAVMTPDAVVFPVSSGFWIRRNGAVNCTVTVRLGD